MKKEVVLNMILSSVDKGSGVWILEVVGGWVGVGVGVVGSVCDKGHCYQSQSIILQYTCSFSSQDYKIHFNLRSHCFYVFNLNLFKFYRTAMIIKIHTK